MNPLSDFLQPLKNGHVLTQEQAEIAKIGAFSSGIGTLSAYTETGCQIILGEPGAKLEDVDLVGGLWRVQNKFKHKIVRVRDKDVVLMEKLPHQESTNFEYWNAKLVGYNCYGPFILQGNKPDLIVARYDTDNGPLWGYGQTLESARAFLGLKLYDEYKDVIHSIACKNKLKNRAK